MVSDKEMIDKMIIQIWWRRKYENRVWRNQRINEESSEVVRFKFNRSWNNETLLNYIHLTPLYGYGCRHSVKKVLHVGMNTSKSVHTCIHIYTHTYTHRHTHKQIHTRTSITLNALSSNEFKSLVISR